MRKPKRGVLHDDNQLGNDDRQHGAHSLREQNGAQHLALGQAHGQTGLALALGQRLNAGTEHLRQHRAVVQDQANHHGDEGRDALDARRRAGRST